MVFTARSRQNPFAKRRREQAAAKAAEAAAAPEPVAVPFDRNAESEEYVQAPDIATFATGGVVEQPKPMLVEPSADEAHAAADELTQLGEEIDTETKKDFFVELPAAIETVPEEAQRELMQIALPVISPETQAKIDAVVNHAIPPAPAEPVVELVDEPKRGRGRPRPQETIDRDNAVHALLVGADAETGISKESIAAELDEKEQQVYSSLRQLTKEGRAETRYVKPHGYRWFAL